MKPLSRHSDLLAATASTMALCFFLAGCGSQAGSGTGTIIPPPTGAYSGVTFSGSVMAGAQPLAGATVQLYAAGTTGSGSGATALLTTAPTTDAGGAFTIPAGYECPTEAAEIYVVARGGRLGGAAANPAIAMLTTLGACDQITSSSHFVLNEVTTAANVWALSQFLAPGGSIGASATNSIGLANAVAMAANLANPLTGTAPGATFPANGSTPAPRINSLANLLNTCTAATSGSSACTTLLSSHTDTLDAALAIVRNPGTNVAALYSQSVAGKAFSPALAAAPADWTMSLNFTGGGMSEPTGLGVDSKGNIWVGSYFLAGDQSTGSVTEFNPLGKSIFPAGITGSGLRSIYALAIDSQDNVWIANEESDSAINNGHGSITVLNSSGQSVSGANGYIAGGINYPLSLAIDTDGSVWVADNWNGNVTKLSSTGKTLSGTLGFTASGIVYAASIAVDANHNAWVGEQYDNHVARFSSDGTKVTLFSCCAAPTGLAFDQLGNIWIANYLGQSVSEISSAGTILSSGGFTANGVLRNPQGMAIDGNGNVWVSNYFADYLVELAGSNSTTPGQPLSPAVGLAPDSGLSEAYALAIDASGNLWVTNFGSNSITEFVGIASPVKTPLIGPPQAP